MPLLQKRLQIALDAFAQFRLEQDVLGIFLKNFFRRHPAMGSKDRKWMKSFLYGYFRFYDRFPEEDLAAAMALGAYLDQQWSESDVVELFELIPKSLQTESKSSPLDLLAVVNQYAPKNSPLPAPTGPFGAPADWSAYLSKSLPIWVNMKQAQQQKVLEEMALAVT